MYWNNPEKAKIGDEIYNINTDFRVALECNKIATDESIGDYERALAIIYKLFGDKGLEKPENFEKLLELAQKYLGCGKEKQKENETPDMDYEQDYNYIVASFMSDFNIDLNKRSLHWWTFFNLLNGLSNSELGNCCILNRVRNLRRYDLSQIKDAKSRKEIEEAQKEVALIKKPKEMSIEQQKNIENFMKMAGLGGA